MDTDVSVFKRKICLKEIMMNTSKYVLDKLSIHEQNISLLGIISRRQNTFNKIVSLSLVFNVYLWYTYAKELSVLKQEIAVMKPEGE